MSNNKQDIFKEKIASVLATDPGNIHLYWKGRVAFYALLKAAGIQNGDEVIIPGFTCVVVPNAILYSSAKPVYVDIQRHSLNPCHKDIIAAVTKKTRVIVLQNTFGLSSETELTTTWARERGILTFEDCTHGFGGSYLGKPNGTFCDASFFSTQWNKPFSTGIGGFAAVFRKDLSDKLTELDQSLVKPEWYEDALLNLLILSHNFLLTPASYYILKGLYRFLSKHHLTIGSSSGSELEDILMPSGYFKAMGKTQINEGIRAITKLVELLNLRKENAQLYTEKLAKHEKYHVHPDLHPYHSFLKYPVLVSDRKKIFESARNEGIELGDWFISPIHPVEKNFDKWLLFFPDIPVAALLASQVLNLPTDTKQPERVLRFLEKNMDLLL